ncbi:MAG: hypothetical protein EOP53_23745 [Sphingobacteriales bacterium]|nr:MAG: hypothetical protein EOP53_23745 [Sphingobacteriales bacterium]
MSEREAFIKIDEVIRKFRQKEKTLGGFNWSVRAKSDWLVFRYRKLYWKKNKINYAIEIFPSFNSYEKITGWNFVCWVYYDVKDDRFYKNIEVKVNVPIEIIAENCTEFIYQAYNFLNRIEKQDIPLATNEV